MARRNFFFFFFFPCVYYIPNSVIYVVRVYIVYPGDYVEELSSRRFTKDNIENAHERCVCEGKPKEKKNTHTYS